MEQGTDDTICDRTAQDVGDLQTQFVAAMTTRTKGTAKKMPQDFCDKTLNANKQLRANYNDATMA